jgi:hypothetical protein
VAPAASADAHRGNGHHRDHADPILDPTRTTPPIVTLTIITPTAITAAVITPTVITPTVIAAAVVASSLLVVSGRFGSVTPLAGRGALSTIAPQ